MTRLIVGPFNRVEGDLEVRLDISDGAVREARVVSPLFRGFERMLSGRPPMDALVYAPRICGICSVSQSVAAASALARLQGLVPPRNGQLATHLVHAVENVADHLTHFYLFFMPDFAREAYQGRPWHARVANRFKALKGTASADMLPARAQFLHALGLLAGKWPHTLSIQPGGSTRAVTANEVARLAAILANFRRFLERHLYAAELEEVAELDSIEALWSWADAQGDDASDFGRFLAVAKDLELHKLGRAGDRFMSFGAYGPGDGALFPAGVLMAGARQPLPSEQITEDVSHAWYAATKGELPPFDGRTEPNLDNPDAYTWCKAPRLGHKVMEVGALARQVVAGQPLLCELVADAGGNVLSRVVARCMEIARVVIAMEQWTAALSPGEPFATHGAMPDTGLAAGLTEAARGSLGHWLSVRHGRIASYQIVAPTTWNFSPRDAAGVPGALEQALEGTPVREGEREPVAVQHIVRSFDPCLVCTVH